MADSAQGLHSATSSTLLPCISRSGLTAAASARVAREAARRGRAFGLSPPRLQVWAYLLQRQRAQGLEGAVPSVVDCPWPQGAAGVEVHRVGLLPGNVPQGHHCLREDTRTTILFLGRIN